jgi:hypothetical protein
MNTPVLVSCPQGLRRSMVKSLQMCVFLFAWLGEPSQGSTWCTVAAAVGDRHAAKLGSDAADSKHPRQPPRGLRST